MKVLIVVLAFGGAVGYTGYATRAKMTEPAIGTVIYSLPATTKPSEPELKQIDAKYVSFVVPMTYLEQAAVAPENPNDLESKTLVATSMSSKVLIINLSKLPSGSLDEDPSYSMRKQNPEKYKIKTVVLKNEKAAVSTSNDSQQFVQTLFWAHEGKLLTFTMNGMAADVESMKREFQAMIESVNWL